MRRDVHYYFQQACRRPLNAAAVPVSFVTQDEAQAGFTFSLGPQDRIAGVEYRCTTCITLVAMCEHLAERLRGASLREARALTADDLMEWHPEIPRSRSSRASLALAAARAALDNISR